MTVHVLDLLGVSGVGKCAYCGVPVVHNDQPWMGTAAEAAWVDPSDPESSLREGWEFATIDHVVPRGQGGADEGFNCVIACWPCNHRKRSRTPAQWGVVL